MSQGPLCPNLTKKFQKKVSQMVNRNLSHPMLWGGLSVNFNHLKNDWIVTHQRNYINTLLWMKFLLSFLLSSDLSSIHTGGTFHNISQFVKIVHEAVADQREMPLVYGWRPLLRKSWIRPWEVKTKNFVSGGEGGGWSKWKTVGSISFVLMQFWAKLAE